MWNTGHYGDGWVNEEELFNFFDPMVTIKRIITKLNKELVRLILNKDQTHYTVEKINNLKEELQIDKVITIF